jgi:hypothetical protein
MTQRFTPDITFILGPPADPELLARFGEVQKPSGAVRDLRQRSLELEPRLAVLLAERDGEPSILSELLSLVLRAPVRVVDAGLGYTFQEDLYSANLNLRPENVQGPPEALARLFEESDPAQAVASGLGLLLKLEWVHSLRSLPADAEDAQ